MDKEKKNELAWDFAEKFRDFFMDWVNSKKEVGLHVAISQAFVGTSVAVSCLIEEVGEGNEKLKSEIRRIFKETTEEVAEAIKEIV